LYQTLNFAHQVRMDWDEEYELLRSGRIAGPSGIDGPRKATLYDLPMPTAAPPLEEETPLQQLIRHRTNEPHALTYFPLRKSYWLVLHHVCLL